jgi:histidyl-tRNA synthetase
MAIKIKAVRGMNDILPEQIRYWHYLEENFRRLAARYGYQEIRTPIIEKTELFQRSIGEVTDIVEKEMYTFCDRKDRSLTLRPENTAGVVRVVIEHGLLHNQTQRLWYCGPLFRYENPQQGRYRQFYQFGVEAFGFAGPEIDAEIILISATLLRELGLFQEVELQINSLGGVETRAKHRTALVDYFKKYELQLDEDCRRRLLTNPLRILDSKNPDLQEVIQQAPKLLDYLDPISEKNFTDLQQILHLADIPYVINPRLVRGLDYYTGTVFEWVTTKLGSQGTVCAGGRYDGLVEELGGSATPAIGFALGCERVIELLKELNKFSDLNQDVDAYLILMGQEAQQKGLVLAEKVRQALPTFRLLSNMGEGSFKNQFKRADKSGARLALILAENEIKTGTIAVKFLREDKEQITLSQGELLEFLSVEESKSERIRN